MSIILIFKHVNTISYFLATKVRLSYEKIWATLDGCCKDAVQEIEDENHLSSSKELKVKVDQALQFESDVARELEQVHEEMSTQEGTAFSPHQGSSKDMDILMSAPAGAVLIN